MSETKRVRFYGLGGDVKTFYGVVTDQGDCWLVTRKDGTRVSVPKSSSVIEHDSESGRR